MKQRTLMLVITAFLLLGPASVAMGAGVLGATDLMYTPTTSTLNPNNFGVAVNFHEGELSYLNFDYGLLKDFELGLAVFNYPRETRLTVRGKYRLLQEHGSTPGLAIGIQDIGSGRDISPYLVVSKTITDIGVKGYLGAGGGSFNGLFAGLEKNFILDKTSRSGSSLNQLNLLLEADSYGLNIGTKLGIGSQTKINFGLVDMRQWIIGATFLFK